MIERLFVRSVQQELAAERKAVREFIQGDALLRRCGEFVQTLWRPEQVERGEEEFSPSVQRLLHVMTGEMAGRDIQRKLGLKQREHFRCFLPGTRTRGRSDREDRPGQADDSAPALPAHRNGSSVEDGPQTEQWDVNGQAPRNRESHP